MTINARRTLPATGRIWACVWLSLAIVLVVIGCGPSQREHDRAAQAAAAAAHAEQMASRAEAAADAAQQAAQAATIAADHAAASVADAAREINAVADRIEAMRQAQLRRGQHPRRARSPSASPAPATR